MSLSDVRMMLSTVRTLCNVFPPACDARERQQWINRIRMVSEMHSSQLVKVSLRITVDSLVDDHIQKKKIGQL